MEEICMPMEMAETRRKMKSPRLTGILLGALIGAGAALLAAPYSGQETRDRIKTRSIEMKEMAASKLHDGRERISELAHKGADTATELKGRGQSIFEEQKNNVVSAIEGLKTGVRTYRQPETYSETYSETALSRSSQSTDLADPTSGLPNTGTTMPHMATDPLMGDHPHSDTHMDEMDSGSEETRSE